MNAEKRSEEFLKLSGQFKLGALVTESSHPGTANLSEMAKQDISASLKLLFGVDDDVVRRFREFVESNRAGEITEVVVAALKGAGRIFFVGCGATGRLSILLDSVWRDFWSSRNETGWRQRTFGVMAGGDYALIKSVEGFEDFAIFGRKQLRDLGVRAGDVVFAITEGGETSFVIGAAWESVDVRAKVYFIYNNPDDILCRNVERSREVIEDKRIEKINLTTGPMAITGSTRMQATSIQLCVMLTILEMVVRRLLGVAGRADPSLERADPASLPKRFLAGLEQLHRNLNLPEFLQQLAPLVALEESVYRSGHRNNYFADRFGIDVLTDTTERSPTYCTPPFRKADDATAAESWAFLFLPQTETPDAWRNVLKREPCCVEWSEDGVRELLENTTARNGLRNQNAVPYQMPKVNRSELMRFRIGLDGLKHRLLGKGDCAVAIVSGRETDSLAVGGFFRVQLEAAQTSGAKTGCIYFESRGEQRFLAVPTFFGSQDVDQAMPHADVMVRVPVPESDFLLNGLTRVAVKLVMNALSTCTMVRLGRVMGNTMIWVVPSNLKLIDRATRYIEKLTGLTYRQANGLLFETLEYLEPRMKSDQAYPPVVGLAVLRAQHGCSNEEAERKWTKI